MKIYYSCKFLHNKYCNNTQKVGNKTDTRQNRQNILKIEDLIHLSQFRSDQGIGFDYL